VELKTELTEEYARNIELRERIANLEAALREIRAIIGAIASSTWHWMYKIDDIAEKVLKEGK
jgi:hypothetical protein